jgi:transposase
VTILAGKTRKCQYCKESGLLDSMTFEMSNGKKPVKKFYHENCYSDYLKDKEFKQKEAEELDILVEKIKEIFGAKAVPSSIYPYLQDLRNGTKFFGKYDYKYKGGYTYDLITETFDYCSETIEYWVARKNFNGLTSALKYSLAIVCDKLQVVENRRKQREKQRQLIDKHIENVDVEAQEFETSYKKKQSNDISDFLDD